MRFLGWIFAILTLVAPVLGQRLGFGGVLYLQVTAMLAFAAVHGGVRYGFKAMLLFAAVTFVLGNLFENMSILTGFPFGFFEHASISGPRLLHVPIAVGLTHVGAAYLAWSVGSLLLGRADADPRPASPVAIALVGAFVAAAWDACGDPVGTTILKAWAYRHPGGYFGVPLSNFLGWLLAAFSYTLAGGLVLRRGELRRQPRSWSLQPPLLLLLLAAQPALTLSLPDQIVLDAAGRPWRSADLYETATIVALLTLTFMAVTTALVALRAAPDADGPARPDRSARQ